MTISKCKNLVTTTKQFAVTPQTVSQTVLQSGCLFVFSCVLLLNVGCINPETTRLPSFYPSNTQLDGLEFQQQDPYLDPFIGPDGGTRPPDFQRPRNPARQAAEQRLFQGLRQLPQSAPHAAPLTGQRHPNAIQ